MILMIYNYDSFVYNLYQYIGIFDSDIRVMENMLRRDTASVEDDFGLGGAAVQRAPDEE